MALSWILLSLAVNGHEFWSHSVESRFPRKIRLFCASISLILSQYSTLNFWTLSVAACLLYQVFFYDVVLISVAQRHIAVRLTQFPVLIANNSDKSTKVVSRWAVTSALTNASALVRWLNCGFPLCFGYKFPSVCCCSWLLLDETFRLPKIWWLLF